MHDHVILAARCAGSRKLADLVKHGREAVASPLAYRNGTIAPAQKFDQNGDFVGNLIVIVAGKLRFGGLTQTVDRL